MATKIKCVVTGLEKGVRPAIYNKRIEKYGSEEELLRSYVSNEGKQLLREGLTVDEIRAQVDTANDDTLIPAADLVDLVASVTTKKASKKKANTPKAEAKEVEAEEEAPQEEIDPEVSEFLGLDETEDADAELANA
jgi:hypothetical protein